MSCKVKVNRHGYLAFRLYWNRMESWEGTGLKDTPENRKIVEGRAVLISREIKNRTFDYLKRFPKGNKAHLFRSKTESEAESKTIRGYYEEWIKTKRPPVVRKSLERDYRQCFGRYILPLTGEVRLKDVSTRLLEGFRSDLLERALSLKTVRNIIDGPFRAMMRDARIIDKLISEDPFTGLQWPVMTREKPDPFSEAERDKILITSGERFASRTMRSSTRSSGRGCVPLRLLRFVGAMWTSMREELKLQSLDTWELRTHRRQGQAEEQ
jgi:hypothetical protein